MQSMKYNKYLSIVGDPDIINTYYDGKGTAQKRICGSQKRT